MKKILVLSLIFVLLITGCKNNNKSEDTIPPTIEYKKELTTTEGTEIDLLKDVKVNDNTGGYIKATVEGKYDFSKEGTYKLKYVAIDSSGNKTEEEFTLHVKKEVKYKVFGNTTLHFGKYKMEGDIPENYNGVITINADGTASSTGYYYNSKGNFVKSDLTGTWSFEKESIGGLAGAPWENIKVDGIHFSWSNGEKLGFGVSDKYFGDQFHGYRWYSY